MRSQHSLPEIDLFILHIGRHKAGSSSIQNFLALNAKKLQRLGVLYPEIGRTKKHRGRFAGENHWAHHDLVREINNDLRADPHLGGWSDVGKLATSNPDKKIVISSEGFETLKKPQIAKL